MPIMLFVILALIFVILLIVVTNIVIVPQSMVYVVERLGSYSDTWSAGLHVKIPFIERIAKKVSLKEQVADFPPQPVITRDNVTMQIDTVVFFQVMDAKLYTYGVNQPIAAIESLSATTLRNIIGEMELDHTLTSRDVINGKITAILDEATDKWGIKVNRVEVKNIIPPREIQEAMEKQMKAEREKRAVILKADGEKQAAITAAEGEKEAAILRADAVKQQRATRDARRRRQRALKEAAAAETAPLLAAPRAGGRLLGIAPLLGRIGGRGIAAGACAEARRGIAGRLLRQRRLLCALPLRDRQHHWPQKGRGHRPHPGRHRVHRLPGLHDATARQRQPLRRSAGCGPLHLPAG